MNIRLFRPTDSEAVIKLWQACGLTRPWNNPTLDIERKCALNDEGLIVAEEKGQIIACALFGYDGHRGSVNYLAVDPKKQGQKVGSQLMRYIEDKLKERGCAKINLMVRSDNKKVVDFYDALGYQADDVVVLGKRLIID